MFLNDGDVIVPDLANQRISRFRQDGTLLSDQRLDMSRGIPLRFDMMAEGRLVAQRRLRVPGDSVAPGPDAIVSIPTAETPTDTVARLAAGQSVRVTGGIPEILAFAPDPVWDAARSGRLVTARTDAWRFEIHDAEGRLDRVVTRPHERRRVTARDRESVEDALRERYREQGVPPEVSQAVVDAMEFADFLPAFTAIVLGPRDSLWVQTLLPERELAARGASLDTEKMGSSKWGVFDADGRYMGPVDFPARFQPVRTQGDYFYGVLTDELGVQSVAVYRVLTR